MYIVTAMSGRRRCYPRTTWCAAENKGLSENTSSKYAIRTAQVLLVLALHIDDNTSASLCLLVGVVAEHWVSEDEDGVSGYVRNIPSLDAPTELVPGPTSGKASPLTRNTGLAAEDWQGTYVEAQIRRMVIASRRFRFASTSGTAKYLFRS